MKIILIISAAFMLASCSSLREVEADIFINKITEVRKASWNTYIGHTKNRAYIENESIPLFSGETNKTLMFVDLQKLSKQEKEEFFLRIKQKLEEKEKGNQNSLKDLNQLIDQIK